MIVGDFTIGYMVKTEPKRIYDWVGVDMKLQINYKEKYFLDYFNLTDKKDLIQNLDDICDDADITGVFPDFLILELTQSRFLEDKNIYKLIDKYLEVIQDFLKRKQIWD